MSKVDLAARQAQLTPAKQALFADLLRAVGTPRVETLPRRTEAGPAPLALAQQRLWFIEQLKPESPLYNIPVALRVEGPLDVAVLAACFAEIVRRHEALRTVFAEVAGEPAQVIRPATGMQTPVVDLSALPLTRCEELALVLTSAEAARPFRLTQGPLLRTALLRLGAQHHVALITMHHIVSDGWSMRLLVRETTALYAAFAEGKPSPLPELPVQYADFAAWQRSCLQGEVLEGEIAYWRRQLAGLPPVLDLPFDHPRPPVQSFRGAARGIHLPVALAAQVQRLGRGMGATPFMVLLAAFQALLARYSGQTDVAVGIPAAGRSRLETEGLIGFFVNTLVMRGDFADAPSFAELIGRVRKAVLAAHAHQSVPFEKLVEELAPVRSLAHAPLFQVMFVLQNAATESLVIEGVRLRPIGTAGSTAKFDLTLTLEEWDSGLSGSMEYATDLFDSAMIERLIAHFERLLTEAVATPEKSVFALPLLSAAERQQILVEWSATGGEPSEQTITELFEEQVRRTPEAVAVVHGFRIELGEVESVLSGLAGVSAAVVLAREGAEVLVIAADVSDPDEMRSVVTAAHERFGVLSGTGDV
jgi:hypothetical protein